MIKAKRIKMKRLTPDFQYILMVVLVSCLWGCKDDYTGESYNAVPSMSARYIYCSVSDLEFESKSSSKELSVTAVNTSWRFSGMDDGWLHLSQTSGSGDATISVEVDENASVDVVRTCLLTLQSETADYHFSKEIQVTQDNAEPYLDIAETQLDFVATGETKKVAVSTNVDYTVDVEETWLKVTVSEDKKTLEVTADLNPTAKRRSATISLKGTIDKTISVSQAGSGITVSQKAMNVGVDGGNYEIQLQSDAPWTAPCDYSWMVVTPDKGDAGTSKVLLEVSPNMSTSSRTGYVQFFIGTSKVVEMKIEQEGISLEVSRTKVEFDADTCSSDIDVTCNCNAKWQVLDKPAWVSATPTSFKGDGKLTLSVPYYYDTSSRDGFVTVGIDGLDIYKKVTVTQKARTFENLIWKLSFGANPDNQQFTITYSSSWTLSSNESWLKLSHTSGKGVTNVTATVEENKSDQPRMALITVKEGDKEKIILVKQEAHCLTLTPSQLSNLPSTEGSHVLSISSDDSWQATTKASWLTVSPASGTGSIELTVTAADNPSIHARKDTVFITPSYAPQVKAVISQDARYLTVNTQEIYFYYLGGLSNPVTVSADGTYSVTTSDSWLTIQENGKTFTVTATENTTDDIREGKIVVTLTGLVEGESKSVEIPVTQHVKRQGIDKDEFSPDEDWGSSMTNPANILSIKKL